MTDKLKMHTPNKADENFKKLAALFPNAVTETIDEFGEVVRAIDKDILMQEISTTVVEGKDERYQFTWPDKKKSILLANAPINKTLRPCREESINFDSTENLYIEGDNLEVLKLLQETYLGQVKIIYIDPPYNTNNDFIYEDTFVQSMEEYIENSGQHDSEGNKLVQNLESNGRFHTDWLNMIYPRIKIAKDLLKEDGAMFISIDENEITNLRKVCDEIFGKSNFIDTLHWKRKKQPSFLAKHTAKVMEYVVIYAKNFNLLEKLSIETLSDATKKVINISNQECMRHFDSGVRVKIGENGVIKKGRYTIKTMDVEYLSDVEYINGRTTTPVDVIARFSVSQEKISSYIKDDLLFITANSGLRRDVSEEEQNGRKSITDLLLEYGDNQDSDNEFKELFDEKYFDYTKPTKLVYNFIKSLYTQDEIILDFFSGSATTAHAVMQLNAEDNGNRKFIMVQLPEETGETSEAYKAGYKNICEIGKERIRRAGNQIKQHILGSAATSLLVAISDKNMDTEMNEYAEEKLEMAHNIDIGFRVLKCDSSNMKDVYYNPQDIEISLFNDLIDNIKEDRTPEDLLFQVMLDLGVLLSSKIEESTIGGKKVFNVAEGFLIACFDADITEEVVTEIAKQHPYYFVTRDNSMANDNVATNFEQIFATYSPDTVRKVL